MTTAIREIRPFETSSQLESFLHATNLVIDDTTIPAEGRIVLSEEEYLRCGITVKLGASEADFATTMRDIADDLAKIDLAPADVLIVVNLYSSFLKISEFPRTIALQDIGLQDLSIPVTGDGPRPASLRAIKSGCQVEVSAVLAREFPYRPLRPWRKGTWLARATFSIATEGIFNGFTPRPLDKDKKEEFGLPPKATRYVVVPDAIDPLSDEASPDLVELWVDAELLASISANDKSDGSIALQRQLFVDAFAAVVVAVRSQPEFESTPWSDIPRSILGKMIRALASPKRGESEEAVRQRCEAYLSLLKKDPAAFLAHAEAFADCTASFTKMIGV